LMVEQKERGGAEPGGIPFTRPSINSESSFWSHASPRMMSSHAGSVANTKNLASVSLEDGQGSYGVGVAAAAAVSALNARGKVLSDGILSLVTLCIVR
jgi:hypothetical protein